MNLAINDLLAVLLTDLLLDTLRASAPVWIASVASEPWQTARQVTLVGRPRPSSGYRTLFES